MNQIDWLAFGLGALCTLTLVLLIGFGIVLAFASWAWNRVSECDDLGLTREDGKVKLGGTLIDLKRPKPKGIRKVADVVRTNGHGRERLS